MSNVAELKKAAEKLSATERWDFFVWLRESEDVRARQRADLLANLRLGLDQAQRGDVAPLDISSLRARIKAAAKP